MRNRLLPASLIVAVSPLAALANTVRAPLVAHVTVAGSSVTWFTETRVWNLATVTASVQVTDIVGSGDIQTISFTVPANGIADLPYYFFSADPDAPGDSMATVEFTSDQPIMVETSVNTYMVTPPECPHGGAGTEGSVHFFPYYAGCVPIAGPLLHGFESYLAPGTPNALLWLTTDFEAFRTNLYLVNPSASPITVTGNFHGAVADSIATATYAVPAHSIVTQPNMFQGDPRVSGLDSVQGTGANKSLESAATAVFTADGPFYVFASVLSNDILGRPSVVNRFAIVQPVPLP